MNKVTVYVPCFNAEKTLTYCLDGIFQQTYPPEEVFLIDDGSTDRTCEIAASYKLRILSHDKNLGIAAARNTAIAEAQTEYIASIDADCIADPQWLETLMESFTHADYAGVSGKLIEKYTTGVANFWRIIHMPQHWGGFPVIDPPFLFGCNTVFKKAALSAVGGYNSAYVTNYEDVEISKRLYNDNHRLLYNPRTFVVHLKEDTVASVLCRYYRWSCFCGIERVSRHSFGRNVAFLLGRLSMITKEPYEFLRADMRDKRYALVILDILLLFAGILYYGKRLITLFLRRKRGPYIL